MPNIVTIIGTRPQYIKAVPVSLALRDKGLSEFVVDTGQHFDFEMSGIFMRELGLRPPDVNLGLSGMSHARMTAAMLPPIEDILIEQKPDIALIYGDTNTSVAAALAAAKLDIPIAHVEGGIRTAIWNPEEINRRVVDTVSDWIFCPTRSAHEHCVNEGLEAEAHYVGDVMYDTLLLARDLDGPGNDPLARHNLLPGAYIVVTFHRPENTGSESRLREIMGFVRSAAQGQPIVFPMHPRVAAALRSWNIDTGEIIVTPPMGYLDMARLAASAREIVTDSGGLQKEAYFHRVPVTVVNSDTPWPVLREAGWLRLWTDPGFGPRREVNDFGDGDAGARIASILGAG